jgi:hypothetical protein
MTKIYLNLEFLINYIEHYFFCGIVVLKQTSTYKNIVKNVDVIKRNYSFADKNPVPHKATIESKNKSIPDLFLLSSTNYNTIKKTNRPIFILKFILDLTISS